MFSVIFHWDYPPLHQSSAELVLCGLDGTLFTVYFAASQIPIQTLPSGPFFIPFHFIHFIQKNIQG